MAMTASAVATRTGEGATPAVTTVTKTSATGDAADRSVTVRGRAEATATGFRVLSKVVTSLPSRQVPPHIGTNRRILENLAESGPAPAPRSGSGGR